MLSLFSETEFTFYIIRFMNHRVGRNQNFRGDEMERKEVGTTGLKLKGKYQQTFRIDINCW